MSKFMSVDEARAKTIFGMSKAYKKALKDVKCRIEYACSRGLYAITIYEKYTFGGQQAVCNEVIKALIDAGYHVREASFGEIEVSWKEEK